MGVLRIALVVTALAAPVTGAVAATDAILGTRDSSANGLGAHALTARLVAETAEAFKQALDKARDHGSAIEKAALDGVRSAYEKDGYAPLWLKNGRASGEMIALRRAMDRADEYGLDPAAYPTPHYLMRNFYNPQRLAMADVEFSRAVARFVTHIASGHIEPGQISQLITLEPQRPDTGEALARLSTAASVDTVLAGYEPQDPQYAALKAKLAELRAAGPEKERIVVPDGKLLKPGMSDERVPTLRERLGVQLPAPETESADAEIAAEGAPENADAKQAVADAPAVDAAVDVAIDINVYDDALVAAVEAFQEEKGLTVDGIIGPSTLATMNGRSREEDINAIVANMERWRWMPRDLGKVHIAVNVPEFMVRLVEDRKVAYETRVVVGKTTNRTPIFSDTMSHIIVNPYWNVPTSILRKEMLPEITANPYGYFARHGYQVLANINGRYQQVDPTRINWQAVNPRSIHVRQVPGANNALGRIKFMFPNQHSVYLHDTPSKSLFRRDMRAFSHGCVRVQNPMDFADAILPVVAPDWSASRLEALFGGPERRVDFGTKLPIHLTYFTLEVGPNGELHRFDDVYGYDKEMTAIASS